MSKVGTRLIESARQAVAYASGDTREGFVVHKSKKKVDAARDSVIRKQKVKGHGFQPCR